jgi:hypothetical protein
MLRKFLNNRYLPEIDVQDERVDAALGTRHRAAEGMAVLERSARFVVWRRRLAGHDRQNGFGCWFGFIPGRST